MEGMTLEKLAEVIRTPLPEGMPGEQSFSQVAVSPDQLTPGCLYLALDPSQRTLALEGGAAAVVAAGGGVGCLDADPLEALTRLATWYRRRFHTWLIGITGSTGKTTVKEMVYHVLERDGRTMKTRWDQNDDLGLPLTLLGLEWSHRNAVVEMGFTHPGSIARMSRTARPSAGLITCIGSAHLAQCGGPEGLLREKLSITEGMNASAPLILNGDDPLLQRAYEFVSQEIISYGLDNQSADVCGRILSEDLTGSEMEVRYFGKKQQLHVPLWGRIGCYNTLAAFTVGLVAGMDPAQITQGIADFRPVAHRLQLLHCGEVTVLDDSYTTSPESVREALRLLSLLPARRRIAVLGDMEDLGEIAENAHRAVGRRAAQQNIDTLIWVGEYAPIVEEEARRMGGIRTLTFPDTRSLTTYLQNDRRPGDTVLVKGARSARLEELIEAVWHPERQEQNT